MWQLGLALALLALGACFVVRDKCVSLAAIGIFANWAINTEVVNLTDDVVVTEPGNVVDTWRVEARGRIR